MIGFRKTPRTVIQDAEPDDAAAMSAIHEKSFARGWSEEEMRTLIADYPIIQPLVLRIRESGRTSVAGFVIIRTAGGEAEILTLAIEPQSRRRGYGRRLMEDAARRGYRDRLEALFLEVDESNKPAVALYESLGFKTVGRRPRYYGGDNGGTGTALVMRLGLR